MATNYFPDNYVPIYSPTETYNYIDKYKKILIANISNKWNIILIDPPLVTSALQSWDAYEMVNRCISFDNKNIEDINQIFSNVGAFMRYTYYHLLSNEHYNICCYSPTIYRDSMCDTTNSLVTHDFYIEMATVKDAKTDDIKKHCLDIVEIIKSVNNSSEFNKIQNLEYDINQIGIITFDELVKLYPSLSIEQAITHHVVSNGAHIVIGLYKPFGNKQRFLGGLPASDDYDLCSVLFIYHEIINKVLPIVKISPRPNAEKIKKQLITDLPQIFNTHAYDETIFKHVAKYEPTVGIRIYFSNLMLINLKKYHLAEVVHSNWPDDFIQYVRKNKIFIM